jgi:exopolysaccharide biosynthesis protein
MVARLAARRALLAAAVLALCAFAQSPQLDPRTAKELAPGATLYHLTDTDLVNKEGPISVWLLRLDPARVDLQLALANDEIVGTETVQELAARHGALAAINAGFFLANGDPAGVLALDGRLVSDTRRPRGAVGITRDQSGLKLLFGRVRATARLALQSGRKTSSVDIDGVDTTRALGKLMLFTPSYHADTDTAKGGLEWVVSGQPPRVVSGPHREGKTKIPPNGFVLSFGGAKAPPSLAPLKRGARVTLTVAYDPIEGEPESWPSAQDIVGGAGLLVRNGRDIGDWDMEALTKGFPETRHPRTAIGTAKDGAIWLIAVDGRQPQLSIGMNFAELQRLARRLDLVNALNLDGGGSTTMWVQGSVVNSPSDVAGARKVSDALLVYATPGARVP